MSKTIDLVSLCESVFVELGVLDEAYNSVLRDIAHQAEAFRKESYKAKNAEEKEKIRAQLRTLKSFFVDQINAELPADKKKRTDKEIDSEINKLISNRELVGLRHLTSLIVGELPTWNEE